MIEAGEANIAKQGSRKKLWMTDMILKLMEERRLEKTNTARNIYVSIRTLRNKYK